MEAREAIIQLQSYYFPALGRPELPGGSMAMAAAAALEPGEQTISYTYDDADRLTGAAYRIGDTTGDSYAYGYDAVGNRTTLDTTLGGTTTSTSYTYDDGDRIAAVDGVPYTYDSRGNLTSDGAWTYTYDGAGRMVRAEKPGSVYTYTYNGDGLLVAETIDGVETVFTWDVALAIPQVLATSDGTKNLYGLERIGVEQGGAWRYTLPDALGSVRQWTDPTGGVLAAQSYGPFGEPRDPVGTPPWGFTGEWQDPAGMVYLRARWYNPALGRFTQVDPVAGILLEPATQHPYAYGLNNPLRYHDPSGGQAEAVFELLKQLFQQAQTWAPELEQLGQEIFVRVAPFVQGVVDSAQAYGPKLPAWYESVQRSAQETSRRIKEALQGGNTAEPNPNDPWRWGRNYRGNYEKFYGVAPDADHYQVHHILRQYQAFTDILRKAGVNVDDPRWLREVPINGPQGNIHSWFTTQWNQWFRALGCMPRAEEIVAEAQVLEEQALQRFGPEIYRLGGLVDWKALAEEMAKAAGAN